MIIDLPYCRVWRASRALLTLLPPEKLVKKPYPGQTHVDLDQDGPLKLLTCNLVEPHTDSKEMFSLVCLYGHGRLTVGKPDGTEWGQKFADERTMRDMTSPVSTEIKRGDCIQLWGMAPHQFKRATNSTFLYRNGAQRLQQLSSNWIEQHFINLCKQWHNEK